MIISDLSILFVVLCIFPLVFDDQIRKAQQKQLNLYFLQPKSQHVLFLFVYVRVHSIYYIPLEMVVYFC